MNSQEFSSNLAQSHPAQASSDLISRIIYTDQITWIKNLNDGFE